MGIDKENVASPYVIHVTTYLTQEDARNTINKLRKAGYDAYSATLRISSSKRIYRVYVGRYSSWEVARRLAMELRNYKVSENAIPSPHAWVIQVGSFLSSNDAEEKVDSMRTLGFSPFLFVVSDENFSFPMFRVYLGAFIKNNQARQMMEDLKQLGIPHTLVSP
jgi:cell division septation protein DedD